MLPAEHPRLFSTREIPKRWPTEEGMVATTPAAWRFNVAELAAADLFYRDLLWAVQLELDRVEWPGRANRKGNWSPVAALADVAQLWGLPSADLELPRESRQADYRTTSYKHRPSAWESLLRERGRL
jgi:hypothetical protein